TYCVDAASACDPAAAGAASWTGSVAVGALASGDSKTVRIRAQIKPSSTATSISNTATLSNQSPDDAGSANDSSQISTDVTRSADLGVVKSGPTAAVAGNYVTYQLVVTNHGPSDGTSATLTDTLNSANLQNATYC